MGYNTDFDGELRFTKELTASQISKIQGFFNEDSREHSEWGSVDFYWINLELNEDCSGLRWNGSEKTYDMVNVVNFILEQMRKDDPDFGLEGEMIAQGEEIYDRWTLVIKDGIACEKQLSECTNIDDVLESQEFYDLMQEYRHCPLYDQKGTTEVFERIKDFIKIKVK